MKRLHSLFAVLILSIGLLMACSGPSSKGDGTITTVNVDGNEVLVCSLENVKTQKTILLSEMAEDCELIRLDQDEKALVKVWLTTVTDNYIGIRQHGGAFKLFDRKGNFISDIGTIGNGPGEYRINVYDEIIDEKNNRILLAPFMGKNINVFDLEGNFLKDIGLPHQVQKPKISLSEEDELVLIHMPFADDRAFALRLDTDGNIRKETAPPDQLLVTSFDGEIFSYRNGEAFEFHHSNIDTLFHLDLRTLTPKPVYTVLYPPAQQEWAHSLYEYPHHFFVNAYNWKTGEGKKYITDKKTRTTSEVTIRNDFFGGLEIPPYLFNKGYLVHNLEPGQLIELIETRLKESDCTGEDKEKLQALMDTIDEDGNNLLFISKLKQ